MYDCILSRLQYNYHIMSYYSTVYDKEGTETRCVWSTGSVSRVASGWSHALTASSAVPFARARLVRVRGGSNWPIRERQRQLGPQDLHGRPGAPPVGGWHGEVPRAPKSTSRAASEPLSHLRRAPTAPTEPVPVASPSESDFKRDRVGARVRRI